MSRDRTPAEPDAERLQALIDGWAKEGLLLPGERSRTPTERPFGIDPAGTAGRRDRTEPGDLADLALLAHALERALPMTAPAPFKADLQARLQDLMQERPRRRRASALLRLAPKLAAAAAAIVLAFGSAVVVSADSLPGQALYPVKRAVEDTRLALTLDPAARARLRLDMAVSRADELEGLLASGAPFGAEVIEDLIAAREAALAAATEVNDTTLSARIDASSDEVDALVEQAYLRLPEAGEAQPAPTSRALSGPNGTATGILVTADAATPRSTLDAGEPGGGEGADEPPRPVAPGSGSAPVRPARFASPTPGTSEVGPPTRPLGPPTSGAPTGIATAVPATARPTDPPTNEPTLDRGAQREATVRAGTHVAPEESAGAATSEAAPTAAHPPGSEALRRGAARSTTAILVRFGAGRLARIGMAPTALLVAAALVSGALGSAPVGVTPPASAALSGELGAALSVIHLPFCDAGRRGVGTPGPATREALAWTATSAAATRTALARPSSRPTEPSSPSALPTETRSSATPSPSPSPAGGDPTPTATASATAEATVSVTPHDPAEDVVRPMAALRSRQVSASYDRDRRTVRLTTEDRSGLAYEIDMGHPDLERGRLSVFETLSGRYPVTAAGFLYRTLDGRLVEPWLAGSLGQVESVTHTMLADGVVIAVRETLEGRRHRRTFTVRRIGDALQIRARSLDGPGLASGGYAGFSAGEIAGTSDGVAIRVPMMDTVPVTMLDHRWFVSALPDYPRSRASRFSQRGPEALANGFVNEMMALYEPDEAGDATPTDETVWVTLSPDIRDTFAVPSASASAYRRDLDGRVHLSLSVGSEPNAGSYEGAARYIERLRSFGVDDLAVHLRDWSDPDTPPPHPGLPDPARGGEAGWRELMVAAAGGLAPSRTYTTTVAGCPGALNPFYRPEDRVTGTDGQPKRLTDQAGGLIACPDGSEAVRYLLAPDAALRIALEPECAVPGTSAAHVAEIAAWNPAYPLPGAQDNALDRAAPANHAATVAEAVAAYKRLFLGLQASGGPVYADGATHWGPMGFDSFYAGYVDALARFVVGHDASSGGTVTLVAPDYELLVIRPRTVAYGLGRYADFFADDLVDGSLGVPLGDDAVDRWRATNLAFGHAGSWSSGDSLGARDWLSPPEQVKEYHLMRALQRRILSSGTARVTYHSGGSVGDLSWALASELDLSAPRIRLEFDSLELWVNFAAEPWSIDSAAGSWQLPTYGWLATGDDHFLAYSAVQDGRRVDLVSAPEVTLIDGRGVYWSAAGLAGTDLAIRLADGRRIEEVPGGDLRVLP